MADFDDEDVPKLSTETLIALQEFYEEQEKRNTIHLQGFEQDETNVVSENWQLSQFWYDDDTVTSLETVAKKSVPFSRKIALISCPTLYKNMRDSGHFSEVSLFEYDKRFSICGEDFKYYDYNSPTSVPKDKESYYDLVIADPPFLSEICLEKFAVTIRFLAKDKIILCTGYNFCKIIVVKISIELVELEFQWHHIFAEALYGFRIAIYGYPNSVMNNSFVR